MPSRRRTLIPPLAALADVSEIAYKGKELSFTTILNQFITLIPLKILFNWRKVFCSNNLCSSL